jgi:hypothetical protein
VLVLKEAFIGGVDDDDDDDDEADDSFRLDIMMTSQ